MELGCTTRSNEATEETIKLVQEKTKEQEGGKSKEGGVLDGVLGIVGKAVGSATDKVGETVNDAKESVAELPAVTIKVVDMFEGLLTVSNDSQVKYQRGNILCKLAESHDSIGKKIKTINEKGNPLDRVKVGDLEKIIGKQPDAQRRARSGTPRRCSQRGREFARRRREYLGSFRVLSQRHRRQVRQGYLQWLPGRCTCGR